MRRLTRAGVLAGAFLTSMHATAQLVVADSSFLSPNPLVTYDLTTGVATPIVGWPGPQGPAAVAADEASQVLYLLTTAGDLYRWPYGDPAPILVGPASALTPQGMTFAGGMLYIGFRNLCRNVVLEVDPATALGTVYFDNRAVGQHGIGLAFDSSTASMYATYHENGNSIGGGCAGFPGGPFGMHLLDPVTQTSTLVASYPGLPYAAAATIGDGKLWLHAVSATPLPYFDNLDLATLVWDATPPANTLSYGFAGLQDITWAPTLVFGGDGPAAYCTPKTSSAGCVAQIATSNGSAQPTSGASDYAVIASQVQEGKNGLLFAGLSGPASLPFNGGVLCVQPPTKRGPIMSSGGDNPVECDGSFSTLVNDGAVLPFGLDAGSGNSAWYQYWYRDPLNGAGQLGTALTDAVQLDYL